MLLLYEQGGVCRRSVALLAGARPALRRGAAPVASCSRGARASRAERRSLAEDTTVRAVTDANGRFRLTGLTGTPGGGDAHRPRVGFRPLADACASETPVSASCSPRSRSG